MASTLIDRFTSSFRHDKYRDEYTDRLLDVIQRKRKGEEIHAAAPVEEEAAPDLLEALRASVEAARSRSGSRSKSSSRGRSKRKPSGRRQTRSRAKR